MKQMSLRALLGAFTLSTFVATSAFAQDSIHLNRSIETLQKMSQFSDYSRAIFRWQTPALSRVPD